MAIRCVYTDLDGTLLGRRGSLFRGADGAFSMLAARGLEACHRAGVEVVLKSGRRKAEVSEDARLIGQGSYVYEVGAGLVIDGEETLLTGDLRPTETQTIHAQIEESGAPALLFDAYAGRLEHHAPWHLRRDISHLMRGLVDAAEANALLLEHGHRAIRLVDNGAIAPGDTLGGAPALGGEPRVYHLMPAEASKVRAVARHRDARGYSPEECIAVGDSREDLEVAAAVGRFFLVANGLERDPAITEALAARPNASVTGGRNGEGFYEAVVESVMAARQG